MSANTSSRNKGIIIQYDYCDGCHACEMACKQEHGYAPDQYGIKINTYGPKKIGENKWDYFNIPMFTGLCDMCAKRTHEGKLPACVHHCRPKVMEWGELDDLARKMAVVPGCVLYAPGVK